MKYHQGEPNGGPLLEGMEKLGQKSYAKWIPNHQLTPVFVPPRNPFARKVINFDGKSVGPYETLQCRPYPSFKAPTSTSTLITSRILVSVNLYGPINCLFEYIFSNQKRNWPTSWVRTRPIKATDTETNFLTAKRVKFSTNVKSHATQRAFQTFCQFPTPHHSYRFTASASYRVPSSVESAWFSIWHFTAQEKSGTPPVATKEQGTMTSLTAKRNLTTFTSATLRLFCPFLIQTFSRW